MTVRGVNVERPAGAVRDIAEMAKHRAFVAFVDRAVGHRAGANGIDEVDHVLGPAVFAFFAFVD